MVAEPNEDSFVAAKLAMVLELKNFSASPQPPNVVTVNKINNKIRIFNGRAKKKQMELSASSRIIWGNGIGMENGEEQTIPKDSFPNNSFSGLLLMKSESFTEKRKYTYDEEEQLVS